MSREGREVSEGKKVFTFVFLRVLRATIPALLKIVDDNFPRQPLREFFRELNVLRMQLIFVFRFLVGERKVQGDLIGLIHDGAVACNHFADVK